jgi:ABC-type sugar transport system ATPase subunit
LESVELINVSKQFDGSVPVVRDLCLSIEPGEFFTLLGPSGCGKTTTLRMIAGLDMPTKGRIQIGTRDCTTVHPRDRGVGMVFQSYALYPHMSVFENIALNLRVQGVSREEIDRRVRIVAQTLQLSSLLERRPKNLSGGERQRVAVGRALVRNPRVLLMDEPLSNLDLKLREHMRTEMRRLHEESRHTILYVTHDQAEAMTMSDRIAVMRGGVVEQVGPPEEVYSKPANTFVAGFLGTPSINLLRATLISRGPKVAIHLEATSYLMEAEVAEFDQHAASSGNILVGVRPEDVLVAGDGDGIAAKVTMVELTGPSKLLHLEIESSSARIVAMVEGQRAHRPGDVVSITWRSGRRILFDGESEKLIGVL